MQLRLLLHLFLLPATLCAADPVPPPVVTVTVSGPTTVEVGKKCVLTAETTAKKVTWKLPPTVDTLALDGKRLAVWAVPGTYTFEAMVPSGDDVVTQTYILTVTGTVPVPPVDTLAAVVQAAYTTDPSATKAADKAALAAVFRAVADAVNSTSIQTAQNLFDVIHNSTESRLPGRLKTVRQAIGTDLGKFMPSASGAILTAQNRTDAATNLKRYATILEGVK